jgi:hypothetical protein
MPLEFAFPSSFLTLFFHPFVKNLFWKMCTLLEFLCVCTQFDFCFIHRNILMMASANSMEVGVLGLQDDQISWEQWTQEDAARAELPLSVDKQETFPVGFGLDTSTQHELPWGKLEALSL